MDKKNWRGIDGDTITFGIFFIWILVYAAIGIIEGTFGQGRAENQRALVNISCVESTVCFGALFFCGSRNFQAAFPTLIKRRLSSCDYPKCNCDTVSFLEDNEYAKLSTLQLRDIPLICSCRAPMVYLGKL